MTQPLGEDLNRNQHIVNEILDLTNHKLQKPAITEDEKAFRQLKLANKSVQEAVIDYYKEHPVATNVPELRKLVMGIYAVEFSKWSKDDVIFMLTLQQTLLALKKFGY